jgi:hypothetical protein
MKSLIDILYEGTSDIAWDEIGSSCPVRSLNYGGMPTGGGFGAKTEYEVGAQRAAEAAHCILGSLGRRITGDVDDWDAMRRTERGHLEEEIGIIRRIMEEYSKPLYVQRFIEYYSDPARRKYAQGTIDSIKQTAPRLMRQASAASSALTRSKEGMHPAVFEVAQTAYVFIRHLAKSMLDSIEQFEETGRMDSAYGREHSAWLWASVLENRINDLLDEPSLNEGHGGSHPEESYEDSVIDGLNMREPDAHLSKERAEELIGYYKDMGLLESKGLDDRQLLKDFIRGLMGEE